MGRTWDEALELRTDHFAEAERLLGQLEEPGAERRDRTEIAAVRSDFNAALTEIREIDAALRAYTASVRHRRRRWLIARYGYAPDVAWRENETHDEYLARRDRRWAPMLRRSGYPPFLRCAQVHRGVTHI